MWFGYIKSVGQYWPIQTESSVNDKNFNILQILSTKCQLEMCRYMQKPFVIYSPCTIKENTMLTTLPIGKISIKG